MAFAAASAVIHDWVADGVVPGAAIAIIHRGKLVHIDYAGEAQPGVPVTADTLFPLASLSKPITAAAVLTLCDEGLLNLDTPVVDVVPEFGADVDQLEANAMLESLRDTITLRQLMAHLSGLPENVSRDLFDPSSLGTRDEQIDIMMRVPLASAPGDHLRYSNIGPAIASRAAELVTGKDFPTIIRESVLQPMGLHNTILEPTPEESGRIATLKDPANPGTDWESYNSPWWRDSAIPWGGYYSSVEDMVRFTASFLPGGASILSPESIAAMTTDQANGVPGDVESMRTHWYPGFWAVGWEIKGTKPHHWTGNLTSPQTWDHWGFAGVLTWADPTRELAVSIFANRSVSSLWMFKPARWVSLCDAICAAADNDGK